MRRLLVLTSAIVFFDTLFFAALTPLLPHYSHSLGLTKTGAGVLAAAYPAGALVGAIPSGIVAVRAGVKLTVIVGLTLVAACTLLFGLANTGFELDTARFVQGLASSFSWTGALAWLVAAAPAGSRGSLIGRAFAAAVAGALFGPVLGGVASVAGTGWTFGATAVASLGLVAWAAVTRSEPPQRPQGLGTLARALRDRWMLAGVWFVVLPALLFGTLTVLAPLRLSRLGLGSVAIGALFLGAAALESVNNLAAGRASDRRGTSGPLAVALVSSIVVAALLPWPNRWFELAVLVVCAGPAFGLLYTPGMTLLTNLSESRGLDHGYTFALVNLAWAPGAALGAAGGGALARATTDAVPYLSLSGLCALTLALLWRARRSSGWTSSSAKESSGSSSRTTAAG